MRILILSGSHPRHLYIHRALIDLGEECAAIIMQRETLLPISPPGTSNSDEILFQKHFSDRFQLEKQFFGNPSPATTFSGIPSIFITPEDLNSNRTANFAASFKPDLAFIFGTNIIKDPLLSILPPLTINLHLGLSPWYRGSATLFWPFYFLQPQYAGATFHKIVLEADAGDILHQSVPTLSYADGIHDVGIKTVLQAKSDLIKLLSLYSSQGWSFSKQKHSGRLFLTRDFHPSHLRLIYNTFNNLIVNSYLDGSLCQHSPSLLTQF
jgi:hypothetical protein